MNVIIFNILIALVSVVVDAKKDFLSFDHLTRYSSSFTQQQAAHDVIQRTLPDRGQDFIVQIDPSMTPLDKQTFKLISNGTHVIITSSTGVGATWGFHYFLTQYCGAQITWADRQLNLPKEYPIIAAPGHKIVSNDRFNYYENVCTSSYSFVWWDWPRWQKEIDWMALRGINLPLAFVAQEAIWQRVYLKMGFTQTDLDHHFGGPGFLAWSRMGNTHGWGGPLSDAWMTKQVNLQHKILTQMTSLNMFPVLPAFAGHVPENFDKVFPNSNVTKLGSWSKFNCTYSCTSLLDPTDPLFITVGKSFLEEYRSEFGVPSHIYNADTFNEMTPRSSEPAYIQSCGSAVYKSMATSDPDAIWLMQGWLFRSAFWKPPQVEALVNSVPQDRLIILDLAAAEDTLYKRLKSFYGHPFIFGVLQNYGGTNDLSGMMPAVNQRPFEARQMVNSTMVGTGINPEGINENEIMFEFMNENTWRKEPRNLTSWVSDYVIRRYNVNETYTQTAWQYLKGSVYNNLHTVHRGKNPLVRRPTLHYNADVWYNIGDVYKAFNLMTYASGDPRLHNNSYFKYDYINLLAQCVHLLVIENVKGLQEDYNNKDVLKIREMRYEILSLINNTDDALNSDERYLLGNWLESAKAMGSTPEEKKQYEYNARTQITLWGPRGEILDYAAKLWGGLMSDYYYPRWELFFNELLANMTEGRTFNEKQFRLDVFNRVEQPFTRSNKIYPTKPAGNAIDLVRKFYYRYWPQMKFYVEKQKSQMLFKNTKGTNAIVL